MPHHQVENCDHNNISVRGAPPHPALPIIAAEQAALAELETKVNALRDDVLSLEAQVAELGDAALAMPEDLGEWRDAPHRVSGLVVRIVQTHQLAIQVASLVNGGDQPDHLQPSNFADCHDTDAANDGARQETQ